MRLQTQQQTEMQTRPQTQTWSSFRSIRLHLMTTRAKQRQQSRERREVDVVEGGAATLGNFLKTEVSKKVKYSHWMHFIAMNHYEYLCATHN